MRRLVALSVEGSWSSDWQPASGTERAAVAGPIGKGEEVWLEVESRIGGEVTVRRLLLSAIPFLISERIERYRVIKDSTRAVEKTATTVELLLGSRAA